MFSRRRHVWAYITQGLQFTSAGTRLPNPSGFKTFKIFFSVPSRLRCTFRSSIWIVNMLDNTWLKKKKTNVELCQSTKIPSESTVFRSQTLLKLWLWRRKLSFLTSSEALRLWKLFFSTVSIVWVDKSFKCF